MPIYYIVKNDHRGGTPMDGMGRKKLRLGDVLINGGVITQEQLEKALGLQKGTGRTQKA